MTHARMITIPILIIMAVQVGGATGRIGDPSGRSTERTLLDEATLERNVRGIEACLRLLDTEGGPAFKIVNNFDWYRDMNVLSFLRDVGKHFRLGTMLSKAPTWLILFVRSSIPFFR